MCFCGELSEQSVHLELASFHTASRIAPARKKRANKSER